MFHISGSETEMKVGAVRLFKNASFLGGKKSILFSVLFQDVFVIPNIDTCSNEFPNVHCNTILYYIIRTGKRDGMFLSLAYDRSGSHISSETACRIAKTISLLSFPLENMAIVPQNPYLK